MSRQMMPVMLGLTILPIGAIVIAAYLLVMFGLNAAALAGAILLLSLGVIALAGTVLSKITDVEDWLFTQDEVLRDLTARADRATARLSVVERKLAQPVPGLDKLAADLAALRLDLQRGLARQAEMETQAALAAPSEPARVAAPAEPTGSDQLDLYLQPVVELSIGSTAHYRASLSLSNAKGETVEHAELVSQADRGGMRPALDAHLVRLCAGVLRRLHLKNPGQRIFLPLGKATLAAHAEADDILSLLLSDPELTSGLVFEFGQQDLGSLTAAGVETLARLGRMGATLALRDVYLGGLDLVALRQLGVRFLDFPPHAVDAGSGPSEAWRDFEHRTQALQVQVVVGDIKTPQQAAAASKCARFGHGPFFAPPRKVRRDAGLAATAVPARRASVA